MVSCSEVPNKLTHTHTHYSQISRRTPQIKFKHFVGKNCVYGAALSFKMLLGGDIINKWLKKTKATATKHL